MDVMDVIGMCRALTGERRRVVLICPDVSSAGHAQVADVGDLLMAHGARPIGRGTGIWQLNGHVFRFISAKQDIREIVDAMRGSIVLLLCQPQDFGSDAERFQAIIQALWQRGEAWIVVPQPTPHNAL